MKDYSIGEILDVLREYWEFRYGVNLRERLIENDRAKPNGSSHYSNGNRRTAVKK